MEMRVNQIQQPASVEQVQNREFRPRMVIVRPAGDHQLVYIGRGDEHIQVRAEAK